MAQTKSTMNFGTLIALPLEMRCRHAIDIACSENDELICIRPMRTLKCTKNDT